MKGSPALHEVREDLLGRHSQGFSVNSESQLVTGLQEMSSLPSVKNEKPCLGECIEYGFSLWLRTQTSWTENIS